jgi:pyruvate-formate lyase-activating enzyme
MMKNARILHHVTIETTSCLDPDYFMEAIRYVDWVFTDINIWTRKLTADSPESTTVSFTKNIRRMGAADWWNGVVVPRIPVIPGVNDSDENIDESARFVKDAGLEVINLLPFHRLGDPSTANWVAITVFWIQNLRCRNTCSTCKPWFKKHGLFCFIGYETRFKRNDPRR